MIQLEAPPALAQAALWLVPIGAPAARLAAEIARMADEQGTPRFEPHLTLLSHLELDEPALLPNAEVLARELCPVDLTIAEPEQSPSFFRCVTLRIKDRVPMREARRRAERVFDATGIGAYHPHLSVVYGEFGEPRRLALAARFSNWTDRILTFGMLDVVDVQGTPDEWRRLARLPLGG